jgi:class 3 adenylate cyclase
MLRLSWEWELPASREALWPLVSDTDRFNRDTGIPNLIRKGEDPGRLIAFRKFGYMVRWTEDPFEWSRPGRFGVTRHYLSGPLREMKVSVHLDALPLGGTRLRYETWLQPRYRWLTWPIALIFQTVVKRRFTSVFRGYARAALDSASPVTIKPETTFAPSGKARLASRFQDLLAAGADPLMAARLRLLLESADDADLVRIRPYALAGLWRRSRKEVLEICLLAARSGLLDFRWDLLCPSCRGAKSTSAHLRDVKGPIHCDSCNIDFRASFDRSVEVTFSANKSIRSAQGAEYCVGSPQRTPHIIFRHALEPRTATTLDLSLEPGRYRLRSPSFDGAWHIRVGGSVGGGVGETEGRFHADAAEGGEAHVHAEPPGNGWPREEALWNARPRLSLANPTGRKLVFALERNAWADDAATAAEVTALQTFRDLFAEEALRPGEEISVGSLSFLFTDLRGSTLLYRDAGDAKAFGLVMVHFDILKAAIAGEGGGVVKTIGDAVMAVFPRPQAAVRAALEAHRRLRESQPSLVLKAGVHCGSCIAVNQNDRLDYFGSTLNLSARLLGFCAGGDLVVTREVGEDPETSAWLHDNAAAFEMEELSAPIRGFGQEAFALLRIRPAETPSRASLPALP